MYNKNLVLILSFILMTIIGCGYKLRNTNILLSNKIKIITLNNYNPYNPLMRILRNEIRLNNIKLVYNNEILPSLKIINLSENQETKSLFQDGKIAEYQVILYIYAKLFIPNNGHYPIEIKICRSFFDSLNSALANDSEKDIIRQELYQQAAHQIVQKILMIYSVIEKNNKLYNHDNLR